MINRADYNAPPSRPDSCQQFKVPDACAGVRLDQVLAQLLPEQSRSRLQAWVRDGRVLIDGKQFAPKHKLKGGERVSIAQPETPDTLADAPEAIPLDIVHEDDALIVIHKPAGMVVHPGNGNPTGTLLNALLHHCPQLAEVPRAGIVHRLDKETSGLLAVAKTLTSQTHLVRQLQSRRVHREYLALVHGRPDPAGRVDAAIDRNPTQRTRMAVRVDGGRDAVTHFSVERQFTDCAVVVCTLETGRTHQIRVHMAHIDFPLVGDPVYGRRRCRNPLLQEFPRQALHARRLGLIHPLTQTEVSWSIALADDIAVLIDRLAVAERHGD